MVANVCFWSHGQPLSGSRSRAMRSINAVMARSASLIRLRFLHQVVESQQHAGRRTPDIAIPIRNVAQLHLGFSEAKAAAAHAVIGRVEHEVQGYLESV